MAHRVQDARAEQPVIAGLRERERLHEVTLRQGAHRRAVVGHPRREKHRLAHRGEQLTAYHVVVPAVEHPVGVDAEVLDKGLPRVPAAEPVITDDFRRNTLILVGGPARNAVTRDAMKRLPLTHRFTKPGTTIRDAQTGRTYSYNRTLLGRTDGTDYGLLVKARNPFNSRASLLIIAGSSGYGSWAGTRLITEPSALDETAASGDSFECVFATDVPVRLRL
jgi:hypothetical protein